MMIILRLAKDNLLARKNPFLDNPPELPFPGALSLSNALSLLLNSVCCTTTTTTTDSILCQRAI